jgi:oxygen-dependent protoporphyrinogen oxidase
MTIDVAVIGGGVSGLAVARTLKQRGHRVLVLERQPCVGGKAISERIGDFLMEHGPSAINGGSVEARRWSQQMHLDQQRLELGRGVRRRYLTSGGRLYGIAVHPFGFLTSNYLSWGGRLRLLAEPAMPAGHSGETETVRQFFSRRFGAEFADRVMDPLVGGMLAGDAGELAVGAVFPALVAFERDH